MKFLLSHCIPVALLLCACYMVTLDGFAVRPFATSTVKGCPAAQRNASLGCPCKLEGIPCHDTNTECVSGTCQCNEVSSVINGTCELTFNVASFPDTITLSCNYVQSDAIPCLTLNTTGSTKPLFCNTGGGGQTPVTITVISSQLDNNPPVTDPKTIIDQPFVEIDPNGVAFIGAQNLPNVNLIDDGAMTLRQTYEGYCIDARGVTSNTFTFTVEFGTCPLP
ncbi:hypothetical protein RvY_08346 [Ramazzottius varieornatus]|uniref:Uncharacterized protein n=1 Tax=Ramazzottius varieornatus TaxID=947166 RepID=A0A1D1VDM9_RAMVA|nr:hypothetical protein RvY_08346 [Ramazzottius varieornatus]